MTSTDPHVADFETTLRGRLDAGVVHIATYLKETMRSLDDERDAIQAASDAGDLQEDQTRFKMIRLSAKYEILGRVWDERRAAYVAEEERKRDATGGELALEPVQMLEAMARGELSVTEATREAAAAELRSRRDEIQVGVLSDATLNAYVAAQVGEVSEMTREAARLELENRLALGQTSEKTQV